MQVQHYLRILGRGWWLVALTTLAALIIALIASYFTPSSYRATARFLISPNNNVMSGRDVVNSLATLDKPTVAATYAEILDSDRVYKEASVALKVDPAELSNYKLSAVVLPEANIMTLSATGPDPQLAAAIANTAGQQAVDHIHAIYQVYTISLLDSAQIPSDRFSPNPPRSAIIAMVLGLVAGCVLVILREYLRSPALWARQRHIIDASSGALTRSYAQEQLENVLRSPDNHVSIGLIHFPGLADLFARLPVMSSHEILHRIANIARNELRGRDQFARWNETSFAVMLSNVSPPEAERVVAALQTALLQPFTLRDSDELVVLAPHIVMTNSSNGEEISGLLGRVEAELEHTQLRSVNTAGSTQVPTLA